MWIVRGVDPEVVAERIWVDFKILVRRILGEVPANFSANSTSEFIPRIVWPGFSRVSGSPKIHAQNPSPTRIFEPNSFSRCFAAYWGEEAPGEELPRQRVPTTGVS